MKENKISLKGIDKIIENFEEDGKTTLIVSQNKKIIGALAVADAVKEDSKEALKRLHKNGYITVMITGDNERTAKAIANKIGIDEYHAELLTEDKVNLIGNHIAQDYGHVAMVRDGINDAPALARANVGIAMGAIGSDVALETADLALMQDDLSKLPYLIELSEKIMDVVSANNVEPLFLNGILVRFSLVSYFCCLFVDHNNVPMNHREVFSLP